MYAICFIRIFLPMDNRFSIIIDTRIMKPVIDVLFFDSISAGEMKLYIYQIIIFIYLLVVGIKICHMAVKYRKSRFLLLTAERINSTRTLEIFNKVQHRYNSRFDVEILELKGLNSPISFGIKKKQIIFPTGYIDSLTDQDLYNIFTHEYNHLRNHDTLYKIVVRTFTCFLFWNPFIYFLNREIEQLLELRCDQVSTCESSYTEKKSYLGSILTILKKVKDDNAKSTVIQNSMLSFSLVSADESFIKERFDFVVHQPKKGMGIEDYIVIFTVFLAVALSYSFNLQALYEPEHEDIVTSADTYEIDFGLDCLHINQREADNSYIELHDGSRVIVDDDSLYYWKKNNGRIIYE